VLASNVAVQPASQRVPTERSAAVSRSGNICTCKAERGSTLVWSVPSCVDCMVEPSGSWIFVGLDVLVTFLTIALLIKTWSVGKKWPVAPVSITMGARAEGVLLTFGSCRAVWMLSLFSVRGLSLWLVHGMIALILGLRVVLGDNGSSRRLQVGVFSSGCLRSGRR
jgi:hypothetical protein